MVRQAGPQSVAAVCWICGMRRLRLPRRRPRNAGKRSVNDGADPAAGAGSGTGVDPAVPVSRVPLVSRVSLVPPASLVSLAMAAAPEQGLQAGDQGDEDLFRAHLDLGVAVHAVVEAVGA